MNRISMNKMQEHLLAAAEALSLRIELNPSLTLASGKVLTFDALFPDLSNPNGIFVFDSDGRPFLDPADDREIGEKGFGVSSWAGPKDDEVDLQSYVEVFSEWGWTGDEGKRPEWMIQQVETLDDD
jgi:hypothetical protein